MSGISLSRGQVYTIRYGTKRVSRLRRWWRLRKCHPWPTPENVESPGEV